jgi:sugar phosphate isomerase/epimerase
MASQARKKSVPDRLLGTMITYGYPELSLTSELQLANRLGVSVLEILPEWKLLPDPVSLRRTVASEGLSIHSAHGCWGGQSIKAERVDLGSTAPEVHRQSVDDLMRCIDWLYEAGGTHLVIHPGGLSLPSERDSRRAALAQGLLDLAEHALKSHVVLCVENMPPGVFPGSRMAELFELVAELADPNLALALDTGHAHLSADLLGETLAAGPLLLTTHVHDNDGRQDSHEPPGWGTIDWDGWSKSLDLVDYHGPIMLECVRQLRMDPARLRPEVLEPLLHSGSSAPE